MSCEQRSFKEELFALADKYDVKTLMNILDPYSTEKTDLLIMNYSLTLRKGGLSFQIYQKQYITLWLWSKYN